MPSLALLMITVIVSLAVAQTSTTTPNFVTLTQATQATSSSGTTTPNFVTITQPSTSTLSTSTTIPSTSTTIATSTISSTTPTPMTTTTPTTIATTTMAPSTTSTTVSTVETTTTTTPETTPGTTQAMTNATTTLSTASSSVSSTSLASSTSAQETSTFPLDPSVTPIEGGGFPTWAWVTILAVLLTVIAITVTILLIHEMRRFVNSGFVARRSLGTAVPDPVLKRRQREHDALVLHLEESAVSELRMLLSSKIDNGEFPHPKRFTFLMRRATIGAPPTVELNEARKLFELSLSLYKGNNYLWAEMISCCTRCKDTSLAERTYLDWQGMREERNMEGGLIVMEAMISHYTALKDPEKVARIYEQIRKLGLVPGSYAASSLATSFAKFGEFEKAVAIFRQPGNDSWIAANAILNELCRVGKMDEALVVMNDASKLGYAPNLETFNNLLRAAARAGEKNAIQVVLERMSETNVNANEQTYRMILIGLAYCGSGTEITGEEVRSYYNLAREVSDKPEWLDPRTSGAVVLAFLRIGDVNNAVGILNRELLKKDDSLCVPFAVWERLIECYEQQFNSFAWKKRPDRMQALEGAMVKVGRWMREGYVRESNQSVYAFFRWRRAFLLLMSRLRDTENIVALHEYCESIEAFQSTNTSEALEDSAKLHRLALRAMLRVNEVDRAVLFLQARPRAGKGLVREILSHFMRNKQLCNSPTFEPAIEFCRERGMAIPEVLLEAKQ